MTQITVTHVGRLTQPYGYPNDAPSKPGISKDLRHSARRAVNGVDLEVARGVVYGGQGERREKVREGDGFITQLGVSRVHIALSPIVGSYLSIRASNVAVDMSRAWAICSRERSEGELRPLSI